MLDTVEKYLNSVKGLKWLPHISDSCYYAWFERKEDINQTELDKTLLTLGYDKDSGEYSPNLKVWVNHYTKVE